MQMFPITRQNLLENNPSYGKVVNVDADDDEDAGYLDKQSENYEVNDVSEGTDKAEFANVGENANEMVCESADGGDAKSINERNDGAEREGAEECENNGDESLMLIQTQR